MTSRYWANTNGESLDKLEALDRLANTDAERRGVITVECPHCRMPLEVRLDGTPSPCNYDHDDKVGCGRFVTIAEIDSVN